MTAELIRRLRRPRAMPGVPGFAAALEAEHDLREAADRLAAAERVVEAARIVRRYIASSLAGHTVVVSHYYDPLCEALDGFEKAYSSKQEGSGQEMLALRADPTDLNSAKQETATQHEAKHIPGPCPDCYPEPLNISKQERE